MTLPLRPGPGMSAALLVAFGAVFFGFLLGGIFGAAEDSLKGYLADQGQAALATVYGGDQAAMDAVVNKSWSYFKRAHMHAGAIGTSAVACILALMLLARPGALRLAAAWLSATGAVLYPVFWLLAGMKAPGLGSTGAAKEALNWLAIPGAGACLVGLVLTAFAIAAAQWGRSDAPG